MEGGNQEHTAPGQSSATHETVTLTHSPVFTGTVWIAGTVSVALTATGILYIDDAITLFWLGTLVNVVLSLVKMGLAQVTTHTKALMADALHGLGDVAAEVVTALAYAEASRPPDKEHPWGHGKVESVGAVLVTCILLYMAVSMGWESVQSMLPLFSQLLRIRGTDCSAAAETPTDSTEEATIAGSKGTHGARRAAVAVGVASVFLKEALFQATLIVGEREQSNLVVATAWHHRSDSLAAGVALASQLGASWGQQHLDSLGSGIVASMLAHSAFGSLQDSLNDLLDYNPASDSDARTRCGRDALAQSIGRVQGVRDHSLRTRRMGPYCMVDATIIVDARISASAASMIAEAVHDRVIEDFKPFVTDVVVHVDPAGSPQSHHLDTRAEPPPMAQMVRAEVVEARVREAMLQADSSRPDLPVIVEVSELQTFYSTEGRGDEPNMPYVDVKVDFRLATEEVTIRSAQAVAQAARQRIYAALAGIVRDIDMNLELSDASPEGCAAGDGMRGNACTLPSASGQATSTVPPSSCAGGRVHGSWTIDPCPVERNLQQVTLLWGRGPESRAPRLPPVSRPRTSWTHNRGPSEPRRSVADDPEA